MKITVYERILTNATENNQIYMRIPLPESVGGDAIWITLTRETAEQLVGDLANSIGWLNENILENN